MVHPNQNDLIYLVAPDTLFKSTNNGNTWTKYKYRDHIRSTSYYNSACLGFNDPNLIIINQRDSIYKSNNGGASFTSYPCNLAIQNIMNIPNQSNSLLSIVSNGEGYLIYKSTNLGVSWEPRGLYSVFYWPSRITCGPNNTIYVGYPEAGVFKSINNGDFWKSIGPLKINGVDYGDKIITINDQVYFFEDYPNLYKTSDGGSNWTLVAGNRNHSLQNSTYVNGVGDMIYIPKFDRLHRSFDGGISWEIIPITTIYVSQVIVSPINSDIIICGDGNDLSKSIDGGLTWTFIDTPNSEDIKEIYLSNTNSNRIFIRVHSQPNKLYRSNDLGNSWNLCFNLSSFEEDYSLTQKYNSSDMYLANGSVYKSDDDGTIWNQIYTGSFGTDIIDIVVDQNNINNIYSYYYTDYHHRKIFFSSDAGNSWQDASYGLPSSISDVYDLSISTTTGKVYILTDNGFWSGFPTTTGIDDDILRLEFYLSDNYPNPYNARTIIEYKVAGISFVTLKVYDVLGNEVATLVNDEKLAGKYELNFNASSLASGVYFYQLKAGEYINTKKMILLK